MFWTCVVVEQKGTFSHSLRGPQELCCASYLLTKALPLTKALHTASAKVTEGIWFWSSNSRAHLIHFRLQSSTHFPLSASLMTFILGIPLRSSGALALISFLVLSNRSSMDFLFWVTQNFAKSLFPSRDLRLAVLYRWLGSLTFSRRMNWLTSNFPSRGTLLLLFVAEVSLPDFRMAALLRISLTRFHLLGPLIW